MASWNDSSFGVTRWTLESMDPKHCLRMVLVGRTGVGKSAAGNTILGREAFVSKAQMYSVTNKCQIETGTVAGRKVAVIDTPGLFDSTLSNEAVQREIVNCMGLASPGPHVFLLVISVGRFTQEESETLKLINLTFGDRAKDYTMVLFTRADDLRRYTIEEFIEEGHPEVKNLIKSCAGMYHVFNNKAKKDKEQVLDLFKKIEKMNQMNEGSCYTCEMFQEAEKTMLQICERGCEEREQLRRYKSKIKALEKDLHEHQRQVEELQRYARAKGKEDRDEEHRARQQTRLLEEKLENTEKRLKGDIEAIKNQNAEELHFFRKKYQNTAEFQKKEKFCVVL